MRKLKKIDGFCAPHALLYVSGMPDKTVYDICTFNGFTPEFGMEEFEYIAAAKELGVKLRRVNLKTCGLYHAKLSRFIKAHPVGVYLIYTSCHLFVVDNGKVIDPLSEVAGLSRRVALAWRVL